MKDRVKDIDVFGEGFNFKLPAGKDTYKTLLGSSFTILIAVMLIFYGSIQMQRLVVFGETVVTMSVKDSFFTPDDTITSEEGFKLAFGLTAYDSNQEAIDDPRYGRINAKYVSWGTPGV